MMHVCAGGEGSAHPAAGCSPSHQPSCRQQPQHQGNVSNHAADPKPSLPLSRFSPLSLSQPLPPYACSGHHLSASPWAAGRPPSLSSYHPAPRPPPFLAPCRPPPFHLSSSQSAASCAMSLSCALCSSTMRRSTSRSLKITLGSPSEALGQARSGGGVGGGGSSCNDAVSYSRNDCSREEEMSV